jgi:hypothetical protein
MTTPIVWNYEDIDSNLLAVEHNKEAIGYFRIDTSEFVIITNYSSSPGIPINILRTIVNGYDAALKEANHMLETALSE